MNLGKKMINVAILFLLPTFLSGCLESEEMVTKEGTTTATLSKNEKDYQIIVQIQKEEEVEEKEEIDSWPVFIGEHFRKMEEAIGIPDHGGMTWMYNDALGMYYVSASVRNKIIGRFTMRVDDFKLSRIAGNNRSQGINALAQPTKVLPKNILTSKPYQIYGLTGHQYTRLFDETLLVVWKLGSEKYIQLYIVRANNNLWYEDSYVDDRGNKVSQGVTIGFPQNYQDWNSFGVVNLMQENSFSPGLGYVKCK
jgi:hypothetical protein